MNNIKLFKDIVEANAQGAIGLESPHVDVVDSLGTVNIIKVDSDSFTCTFNTSGKAENVTPVQETQPNDEIWYTSTDESIVRPMYMDFDSGDFYYIEVGSGIEQFGANIISNTYSNGKGIIKFGSVINKALCTFMGFDDPLNPTIYFDAYKLVTISFPDSIEKIGLYVDEMYMSLIYNCNVVKYIKLPNNNINVDGTTTSFIINNPNLETVILPDSMTLISLYFYAINGIKNITLPSSLITLDTMAFMCCGGAESLPPIILIDKITIPANVQTMNPMCLYCINTNEEFTLKEVTMLPIVPPTFNYAFGHGEGIPSDFIIKVPAQSLNVYKAATGWSEYADYITANV